MGSFNETCALSQLTISSGCPVKLLFLTQNPFSHADEHEARRGNYPHDQWFCRTPPLDGVYDDYGRTKLHPSPLPQLIAAVFSTDVIERPYGFNQYHALPVAKRKPLAHYLAAAWEGRLLVQSHYGSVPSVPNTWPTWRRVLARLQRAKLACARPSRAAGYNAQPVRPGVVCVHFFGDQGHGKRLDKAQQVLAPHYDCSLVSTSSAVDEPYLNVVPRGALADPTLLQEPGQFARLCEHPQATTQARALPVLAVLVRQDVWNAFLGVDLSSVIEDTYHTVAKLRQRLEQQYASLPATNAFAAILHAVPAQTTPSTHFLYAHRHHFDAQALFQPCAELARVEVVLGLLSRTWMIPTLGRQDDRWGAQSELLGRLYTLSLQEHHRELRGADS